MNNNSILIDQYLQNEMSAEEKTAFENQLAADKNLQEEFNIQQQIIKAAETEGLKNEFSRAIQKRILIKQLLRWGSIAAIIGAAFLIYALKSNLFTQHNNTAAQGTEKSLPAPEEFNINTAADTIIETKDGVVFAIPAHAFNSGSENITLEIKTALNVADIINNGLSTMSNGSLLQTAGMFSINGFDKGKQLTLIKEIAVSVPANEIDTAMQLFDAVADSNGIINWVNPQPVEKRLRTYDMEQLNFYPPNYIPALKALGKDYQNKKYTDSLYYSFSGYPSHTSAQQPMPGADFEKNDYTGVDSSSSETGNYDVADTPLYSSLYTLQVDPAKIKAIWNKEFNNTLIATKEFEERVQYMHSICVDEPLGLYIKNLNKPMCQIDELIASKIQNEEIKQKFREFAKRKDGSVIVADGIQKKLSNYFYQKAKAYREAVNKTWTKYQDSLTALNNIADLKRRAAALNNFKREAANFQDELCINLTNAYQQIGIKRSCNDTFPPSVTKYYNVTISTTGWKNLDVYVFNATQSRQSMVYTDPATGKTASLTYKDVSISIKNRSQYDRVLVYLIPDSLSSFQRIKEKEGNFTEGLNSLFKYDAVVLAFKGTQAFYFRQPLLQATNYIFSVTPVSIATLQGELKKYSLAKAKDLVTDFEYELFNQKEMERQMQLRKDMEFRDKIAVSIYACGEGTINTGPALK